MDILIAKKDGERMKIKVVRQLKKGYCPANYLKVVNFKDYNDLALLFEDLDVMMSAPIEKAFVKYKENRKGYSFPF